MEEEIQTSRAEPDLTGGCIFAAALAQRVFGGELKGNWHHVWIEKDGAAIDLTEAVGVNIQAGERLALAEELGPSILSPFFQGEDPDPYLDQPDFLATRDFMETWNSVQERADKWHALWLRENSR